MPELPEVEHAKLALERWMKGRRVAEVDVPRSRVLRGEKPARIVEALEGHAVVGVERRGKNLLVVFDDDIGLQIHLGMTGWFSRGGGHPHTRLMLIFEDDFRVSFRDPRMFGRVQVGRASELREEIKSSLGPDPILDPFGPRELHALLAKTKRPIKIALMDQALIAGIGNIYAAEALWRAEIHPDTPAQAIDKKGSARLARAILKSLKSSLDDLERDGDDRFRVYGREGEACFRCKKAQIVRTEHQGRSTFHCPSCQARPRRR